MAPHRSTVERPRSRGTPSASSAAFLSDNHPHASTPRILVISLFPRYDYTTATLCSYSAIDRAPSDACVAVEELVRGTNRTSVLYTATLTLTRRILNTCSVECLARDPADWVLNLWQECKLCSSGKEVINRDYRSPTLCVPPFRPIARRVLSW